MSSQAAHPPLGATDPAAPSPAGAGAPRYGLRNALVALCLVGVPLAWMRDPQLVWQPLLPIPLLMLTPRGVSRALVLFVGVLIVLGGGVTTYRVGMAVPDWPATFERNMWTYPFEEMIAEGRGVTLEHVHRLWASALGLVSICVVLACFVHRAPRRVTTMAFVVLLAIIGQGVLGGTRVLENSQNLAFLHGALAQAVCALIVALAVVCSRTWERARPADSEHARGAHVVASLATVVLYLQISLGAWLRHQGEVLALMAHGTFALIVVALVLVFARVLSSASDDAIEGAPLKRASRWILGSLVAQFTLGVLATVGIYMISGGMDQAVSLGEVVFATAHVLVGAMLLSSTVVGAMFARRTLRAPGGAVA